MDKETDMEKFMDLKLIIFSDLIKILYLHIIDIVNLLQYFLNLFHKKSIFSIIFIFYNIN